MQSTIFVLISMLTKEPCHLSLCVACLQGQNLLVFEISKQHDM